EGANSVRALITHPVMSDPATDRILNSGLTEIIFTDSIPYNKENPKATILTVTKLFADTIRRIHNNQSISSQYLFKP
ncbi:MAG: ribose-phosphate pyrophosphokinase, partial [Muribaculaceae bacterium]|nr:ribose-phosphate pyrophosphokinase [Muribaculaceae bacterium]